MKKTILSATVLLVALMYIVSTATASQGQYGGPYGGKEENASIMVDKLIAVPQDDKGKVKYTYVDNLSSSDYKFRAGSYLWFKIKVKNTSNRFLTNVMVEDTFPQFLEVFPNGYSYDANSRKLSLNLGSLEAGQTKEVTLKARVLPQPQLPSDKGLFCLINNVKVWSGNVSDSDNAQFCVEKQVMGTTTKGGYVPTKEIPSTGAELPILLSLAGSLGYVGTRLRRFGRS